VLRVVTRVDVEEIFVRYFLPLYPLDTRDDLARVRASDANPGRNPSFATHLDEAAQRFVLNAGALFGERLELDGSDASVHRLSAALTMDRRNAWAAGAAEGSATNPLFNVVVHGAAYIGRCIVDTHGGLWSVRRPLWESVVRLKSRVGEAELAVFHWWLKSLDDQALGAGGGANLADRYRAHVEVPRARPESLPILVRGKRLLPRLKDPSYDRLHKYIRAHLAEVRELGKDFPTPERFAAYGFRWMDFHLLGDGRLLLMACASSHGLHLMWVGASGFEKSAFFVCDAFPDPLVRVQGETITAMMSEGEATRMHEMLWWGP
jgi:hypothetical protein